MMKLDEVSGRYSAAAGCDALYAVSDDRVGLVGFIALHDLSAGPGVGGIRRLAYRDDRAAVQDVVDLAEQMTLKVALAGLPVGGAKAVVIARPQLATEVAYGAMGDAIEALGGRYMAGPDVGTGPAELAYVRARTAWVNAIDNEPSESTAAGVLAACEAALTSIGALEGAEPFTAVVQGVGAVGAEVARGLARWGGELAVSDLAPRRAREVAEALGCRVVSVGEDLTAEATLLAPCALGPVITAATIASLRCRVICGAANNQLATPCLSDDLADAGIIYVPDFAVSAGAVIEGVLTYLAAPGEDVRAAVADAIAAIGARAASILAEAAESGWTPMQVALARIEAARAR